MTKLSSVAVVSLSAGLILLFAANLRYRSQTIQLKEEIRLVTEENRRVKDKLLVAIKARLSQNGPTSTTVLQPHLPDKPIYIFHDLNVRLQDLAPGLPLHFDDDFRPELMGSFATPCSPHGSNVEDVVIDEAGVSLPCYGEHYLHTNFGFFKLLALDPDTNADERAIAMTRFVAGNVIHSTSDLPLLESNPGGWPLTPERLLPVLFASDQPLKLHCGPVSDFLCYLLRREQGYSARKIHFGNKDGLGHIAVSMHLNVADRDIYVDPDFGALVTNQAGDYLGIKEVKRIVEDGELGSLKLIDIGRKKYLQQRYNIMLGPFSWTPLCDTEERPYLVQEQFFEMLTNYTHKVEVAF